MQYFIMNKPAGYITAKRDPRRKTVMELFPPELQKVLHPVGRLDKDTEGLLLFTDDGKLDEFLLRPEHHVEKEYEFRAFGRLGQAECDLLAQGVVLEGTEIMAKPGKAVILGYTTIGACEELLPPLRKKHFMKNPERPVTQGRLTITEGRKHQVKLMIKAVGAHVFTLKRLRIGTLFLDETLLSGQYRSLTEDELAQLGYSIRSTNSPE